MNESNASTTENPENDSFHTANDGRHRSISPMTMVSDGKPTIRLDGIYKLIEPVVATLRENFAKVILGLCREMLEHDREIRRRFDTLKKFDTQYRDADDLDESNQPKSKPFIPIFLRNKLSLQCSQLVQKDSRCAAELAEIQTIQDAARSLHETYQKQMAEQMKKIAEIEYKARIIIFANSYSDAIVSIAEGIVVIAKNQPGRKPIETSVSEIAKVTSVYVIKAIATANPTTWNECRFHHSGVDKHLETFLKHHYTKHSITETMINQYNNKPNDYQLIVYAIKKLKEWWPTLTHLLWQTDVKRDTDKKVDAELSDLFECKATVTANTSLADAMETGAELTIVPLIQKEVERAMAKKATASKQASRKKSSGNSKSQESTPARSGRSNHAKSNDESKKNQSRSSQPSKTRSSQSSKKKSKDNQADDDDTSAASNESRKRGRSKSQPVGILKKPKVTFQRGRSSSKRKRKSSKSRSNANRDESNSGESTNESRKK